MNYFELIPTDLKELFLKQLNALYPKEKFLTSEIEELGLTKIDCSNHMKDVYLKIENYIREVQKFKYNLKPVAEIICEIPIKELKTIKYLIERGE